MPYVQMRINEVKPKEKNHGEWVQAKTKRLGLEFPQRRL